MASKMVHRLQGRVQGCVSYSNQTAVSRVVPRVVHRLQGRLYDCFSDNNQTSISRVVPKVVHRLQRDVLFFKFFFLISIKQQ